MRKGLLVLLIGGLVVGWIGGSVEAAKPRVAVINFEVGVSSAPGDIGSGIADMLTTALVKSGKVDVYERSQLQAVLGEQGLSSSGLIDPGTAIKMGKLLGVQYIIMGKITEYGVTESGSDIGSFSFKSNEARVAADCRMIDATTGKIVLADTGIGSESSGGIAESSNSISLGMEGYDTSIIGKAARKAIDEDYSTLGGAEDGKPRVQVVPENQVLPTRVVVERPDRVVGDWGHPVRPSFSITPSTEFTPAMPRSVSRCVSPRTPRSTPYSASSVDAECRPASGAAGRRPGRATRGAGQEVGWRLSGIRRRQRPRRS